MTLGRPLEFSPERALDSAIGVFWSKGYSATSITDLLKATELSKSSLYQTFGSKRQLFASCLERYADGLAMRMAKELAGAKSGRSFIERTFAVAANTARRPAGARGCLIANSASELGQREPSLAAPVADGLGRFAGLFREAVEKGQADGSISTAADPATVANYLLGAINGLRTMIKAGADSRTAEGTVTLILKALD